MSHFLAVVITKKHLLDGGRQELEKALAPYNEATENPKYLKFEEDDDCDVDEKTKRRGYWTNPNAKWDWYQIGGRWSDLIKPISSAEISNIDFSVNKDDYAKAARFWEVVVNQSPLRKDEDESSFNTFFNADYYRNRYGTKKVFATEQASFSPFALIDIDGVWHEKGEMGWFGMNSSNKSSAASFRKLFNKIIKEHQTDYLTIVDCHI
jgi:hypothetical protein